MSGSQGPRVEFDGRSKPKQAHMYQIPGLYEKERDSNLLLPKGPSNRVLFSALSSDVGRKRLSILGERTRIGSSRRDKTM